MLAISTGIALLLLVITPLVWRKLVHPLEIVGWVSGVLTFLLAILLFVTGDLPIPYSCRCLIATLAAEILAVTAVWSRWIWIPDVIMQEGSLRFNKYPYLICFEQEIQPMTNMVYAEVTIENCGSVKAKECEVEITLKDNGTPYRSKVLSADSTKTPNPMTVSVDAHGTIGFHPLCLRLETLEAFLPNYSSGIPGKLTGPLVKHGEYEISGKVFCDGRHTKMTSVGKVKIPDDLLEKATIPNDIQVRIDQGGFAVYLERYHGKVRAKFYGHSNDDNIKRIILDYLKDVPRIDNLIEDNGKLRRWELVAEITNGVIESIKLTDVEKSPS